MEKCNFESGKCSIECKKYPMCMYFSIQKQLSEMQEQISFAYSTLGKIIERENITKESLNNIENKLETFTCDILELFSEKTKESTGNEEKNK